MTSTSGAGLPRAMAVDRGGGATGIGTAGLRRVATVALAAVVVDVLARRSGQDRRVRTGRLFKSSKGT